MLPICVKRLGPLLVAAVFLADVMFAQPAAQPKYEVFAVRFGTLSQFPVSGLVAGADNSRRIDIPVMVWLLKGDNGKRVLVDSGFHQKRFVEQWKVQNFRSPDEAVSAAGVKPEEITDIIISHAHWDHAGGVDLFPKATVWIQREEYTYYTGEAWHARNTHGGIDAEHVQILLKINTEGRLRFVEGDDKEVLPGIRCYTGGRHTRASQYVGVQTADGTAVITSDNMYLYENLEKRVPIAQTLDAASNLAAQDRIRKLASSPSLIVPGHDPAVFERYTRIADGVVRIKKATGETQKVLRAGRTPSHENAAAGRRAPAAGSPIPVLGAKGTCNGRGACGAGRGPRPRPPRERCSVGPRVFFRETGTNRKGAQQRKHRRNTGGHRLL